MLSKQEKISLQELDSIKGTGKDGRVTKEDLLQYLEKRASSPALAQPEKTLAKPSPTYEAPKVITYSEDEIIELLGPAQTCSPSPCPTYS